VKEKRLRVFYALWPDPSLQEALAGWGGLMQRELGGRLTRAEAIHLTLAFIGEIAVDRIPALCAIGERLNSVPVELVFDRVGCWPHNGIAWAGSTATPHSLSDLVADLRSELSVHGFPAESRAFAAHVTLLRKATCVSLQWQPPHPLIWTVRRLVLVRSVPGADGSTYSEVAGWPLQD
jgi:2'-5' RNA ligase